MIDVQLTAKRIPWEKLRCESLQPEHSAHVVFFERVRNAFHGRSLAAISYDAFPGMTLEVFRTICSEAQEKWGDDLCFRLWQRTGRIEAGEICVFSQVTAKDSETCHLASYYVTEEFKKRAPIWKRFHFAESESKYSENSELNL